jgi:hypothetical protein
MNAGALLLVSALGACSRVEWLLRTSLTTDVPTPPMITGAFTDDD